ncbi:ANK_REP_REGION domain-containing protein, partial [Haematococcus lacustris]
FLYGEAEYATYSASPFQAKRAVASALFVLYLVTCLLLLTNLLTALVLHAVKERYAEASRIWRLRWASYVLKAEARMPRAWQRRYRLGEPSYDSSLQQRVYNHVFEVVADKAEDSTALEALEAVMERLKKPKKVAL